ncbi:solute carrier family 22 member 6-like protein [Columba guinea]|nr:solute carrier family 22 member 6-like protein [Columba guinea]
MAFTELLVRLGGMGRFQVATVALLAMPVFMMASHNMLQNFTAAGVAHRCRLRWEDGDNGDNGDNGTGPGERLQAWVPAGEQCRRFVAPQWWLLEPNASVANATWPETEPCRDGWMYNRSVFSSTIVTEALRELRKVAKLNGKKKEGDKLDIEVKGALGHRGGWWGWGPHSDPRFSTSFAYYGLAMDLQNFDFDIFVMQMVFGAVDIPAKLVSVFTMTFVGRRFTQSFTLILAGLAILANILVPQELRTLRTTLAVLGKGCLAASFNCAFLYTGELYPTVIRPTAGKPLANCWPSLQLSSPPPADLDLAMTFAELLARLGGMGRFQVWYVASLAVPLLMLASHNVLQNFTAGVPEHHCRPRAAVNGSAADVPLVVAIPHDGHQRPQRCRRFVEHQWGLLGANGTNGTGGSAATEPCRDGWTYRMEWIPTGTRAVVGTINGYSYTLGQFVLAGMAFAFPHWRRLQLAVSLPFFLFFLYSWFSTSFAYYGLAMDLQGFGVDVYVSQLLFAAVDVPAKLASAVAVMRGGRRVAQGGSLALAGGCILATMLVPNELQALRLTLAVIGKGALAASFNCAYIFTGELFPTAIRQTGLGLGSTMARVGGMMAPLVRVAGDVAPVLPPIIYGVTPVLSALLTLLLPETRNVPLPETLRDLEMR